ncbi:hypothetical protein ATCC90586_001560 [Pythium insidiosum]|nr:hypothetical protein ATCC90586_001560 [Pythium insidiosum]
MDMRVVELQQVIFKKDLMILQLQRQVAAYERHFGVLEDSVLAALMADDAPPVDPMAVNTNSASASVISAVGKNVVLDFVEDSPMFRRQLEGFEESLTGLRSLLKEILSRTKEDMLPAVNTYYSMGQVSSSQTQEGDFRSMRQKQGGTR